MTLSVILSITCPVLHPFIYYLQVAVKSIPRDAMEQHSSPNTVEGCALYYKITLFWGGKGEILCQFTGSLGKRSGKVRNYYQLC